MLQEREAQGRLFKGFFEKNSEALYEEHEATAAQQQQPAVDPAAVEAVDAMLAQLERQQRPPQSTLHSKGVKLALAVGLLAVVLAAAARFSLRLGLGRLLPHAWLPVA